MTLSVLIECSSMMCISMYFSGGHTASIGSCSRNIHYGPQRERGGRYTHYCCMCSECLVHIHSVCECLVLYCVFTTLYVSAYTTYISLCVSASFSLSPQMTDRMPTGSWPLPVYHCRSCRETLRSTSSYSWRSSEPPLRVCCTVNLSNTDTCGAEDGVLISEVSSCERLKYLGWEKVSC